MPITEDADDLVGPTVAARRAADRGGRWDGGGPKVSCRVIGSTFATRSVTWLNVAHAVGTEGAPLGMFW